MSLLCKTEVDEKADEELSYTVNQCEIPSIMFTIKKYTSMFLQKIYLLN